MAYITVEEFRAQIDSKEELDLSLFTDLVVAVSDAIDKHCFRTFVVPTTEAIRYFKPTSDRCEVDDLDDIANTTGLVVAVDTDGSGAYSDVLTVNTDYVLETNRDGMVVAIRSTSRFPTTRFRPRSIKLTARYGFPAVPSPVKRAALIWAGRLWNRKDTPAGVVGFADLGGVRLSRVDPDVGELLGPFVDRGRLLR